jgi:hypothetical protein
MAPVDAATRANLARTEGTSFFVYEDRPAPGRSYVLANGILLLLLVALALASAFVLGPTWGVLVTGILVAGTVFHVLLILHAAYNTVYTLTGGLLELRCGVLFHMELGLDSIQRIEPVRGLPRVAGYGPSGRGFGNRFSNGLWLVTDKGNVYLTPTDPEAFAGLLARHRRTTAPTRKPDTDEQ